MVLCSLFDRDAVVVGTVRFLHTGRVIHSVLYCSPVLKDEASELVPLGSSAWKEKSISPTKVRTCLRYTLAPKILKDEDQSTVIGKAGTHFTSFSISAVTHPPQI